jgi:hypothetical protein
VIVDAGILSGLMKRSREEVVETMVAVKRFKDGDPCYPGFKYMIPYTALPKDSIIRTEHVDRRDRFLCSYSVEAKLTLGRTPMSRVAALHIGECQYEMDIGNYHTLPCIMDIPDHSGMFMTTQRTTRDTWEIRTFRSCLSMWDETNKKYSTFCTSHLTVNDPIGDSLLCLYHIETSSVWLFTNTGDIWRIELWCGMRVKTTRIYGIEKIESWTFPWLGMYMLNGNIYGQMDFGTFLIAAGPEVFETPVYCMDFVIPYGARIKTQIGTYFPWAHYDDGWYRLVDLYLFNGWPVIRRGKFMDVQFHYD